MITVSKAFHLKTFEGLRREATSQGWIGTVALQQLHCLVGLQRGASHFVIAGIRKKGPEPPPEDSSHLSAGTTGRDRRAEFTHTYLSNAVNYNNLNC